MGRITNSLSMRSLMEIEMRLEALTYLITSHQATPVFAPVSRCIALCAICSEKLSKYPTKTILAVSAAYQSDYIIKYC